eukprot:10032855-Prorocentrum_lima.AAC.1
MGEVGPIHTTRGTYRFQDMIANSWKGEFGANRQTGRKECQAHMQHRLSQPIMPDMCVLEDKCNQPHPS